MIAGFLLLPLFGVRTTIYIAAFINIVIGLVTILADRRIETDPSDDLSAATPEAPQVVLESRQTPDARDRTFWFFCAFVSGFVTISTQVAWTRMLTMIIGSSTYAFSIVVALFLLGLSGGAFVVARRNLSLRLRETVVKVELFTAGSLILSLVVANKIPGWLVSIGIGLDVRSWSGLLTLQILSVAV